MDVSWVESLPDSPDLGYGYLQDPEDMVAEIVAYRRIRTAAQSACPWVPVNWAEWYRKDFPDGSFTDLADELSPLMTEASGVLHDYLYGLIAEKENITPETLDDAWFERVCEFVQTPTTETAARTGIDALIPNVVDLTQNIHVARQYHFASWVCQNRPAPLLLSGGVDALPKQAGLFAGDLALWVWVCPDSNNFESKAPDIFLISASLVHQPPGGDAELVAFLAGKLVPTFMRNRHVYSSDMFEIMDAHSAQLNDVWKTVQGELFPKWGIDEFKELTDMFGDDDAPGSAICVPWISVQEKFRGADVAKLLLQALATMSLDVDRRCYPDNVEDQGNSVYQVEEWCHTLSYPRTMLADNPIRLFVLSIEGTKPAGTISVNPLSRGDLSKEGAPHIVDLKVEQRRKGLEKYFLREVSGYQGFYVHTYNPWDYPVT